MKELYKNNLIEFAKLQLEKPYIWNSRGPDEFDCSGLTYYLYKELFNIDINQSGYGKQDITKQFTSNIGILTKYNKKNKDNINKLQPGDLIFFHTQTPNNKYPNHVGIYIGNKQFIHASKKQEKVTISPLTEEWLKKLIASKNIIDNIT